jgi:hypothetical protein
VGLFRFRKVAKRYEKLRSLMKDYLYQAICPPFSLSIIEINNTLAFNDCGAIKTRG